MPKVKIGVIGGGGIAQVHLPRLRKRDDAVELVGIADVNPAAAAVAKKFEINRFVSDYRQLIPHTDAVIIAVPTHLHSEIAVAALNAGKHVFCEKPIARTMPQAQAIVDAARRSGVALQIGFVRRFDHGWLVWRDAILAGKIGRPIVWRDFQSSAGQVAPWFQTDEQGGGPFLDGCIHNLDFGLWTLGPVEWVFAHLRTINPKQTALDTGTATIRFRSGDELALAWSWGLPAGSNSYRHLDLLGPEGRISWLPLEGDRPDGKIEIDCGREKEHLTYARDSLMKGFEDQMDEFIEVAQGRKTPRAGAREGVESLRVGLAVLESARTGEKIYLDAE